MQVAELLLTLSLPKAEKTNFLLQVRLKTSGTQTASASTVNNSVI
jgi:hypothetical protein